MGDYVVFDNKVKYLFLFGFLMTIILSLNFVSPLKNTCTNNMTNITTCQITFETDKDWDNFQDATASYIIPNNWCRTLTKCIAETPCEQYDSCGGTITLGLETVSVWVSIANEFSVDVDYESKEYSESTTTSNQINFDKTSDYIFMPIRGKQLISAYWASSKEDTKIGTLTISPNLSWWDKGPTQGNIVDTLEKANTNTSSITCAPTQKDFSTCTDPTNLPINDYFKIYGAGTYYCSNDKSWYKVNKADMVRCTSFNTQIKPQDNTQPDDESGAKPASSGAAPSGTPGTSGTSGTGAVAQPAATNTTTVKKELPNCFWSGFFVNFYNGTKLYNKELKLGECVNTEYTLQKTKCPPEFLGNLEGSSNSIPFKITSWDSFESEKLRIATFGNYLKINKQNYSYVSECLNENYKQLLKEYMEFTKIEDEGAFILDEAKNIPIKDLWATVATTNTGICSGFDISLTDDSIWKYKCISETKAQSCTLKTNKINPEFEIAKVAKESTKQELINACSTPTATLINCDYADIDSSQLVSVTSNKAYGTAVKGSAPNYTLTKEGTDPTRFNIRITDDVTKKSCVRAHEKGKYLYYKFDTGERYFLLDNSFYNVFRKK
jgi:hypothetical protein